MIHSHAKCYDEWASGTTYPSTNKYVPHKKSNMENQSELYLCSSVLQIPPYSHSQGNILDKRQLKKQS